MKRILMLLLLAALSVSVLLTGCGKSSGADETDRRTPVELAEVTTEATAVPIHLSGRLAAGAESRLSFKTGGYVERFAVDEGASVAKGDLLAVLRLDEIEAHLTQARSGLDKAQRDFDRVERLYRDSAVTLETLQNARTGLDMARSAHTIAEYNAKHSTIYAPASGRILARYAEPNELVGAGQPIFLFGSTGNPWIVRCGVAERDIVSIDLGDSAEVRFEAYPERLFPARVSQVAQSADPRTGLYEVEMHLDNVGTQLRSGFVASITLFAHGAAVRTTIPIGALVEADGAVGFVYVADSSGLYARKLPVTVGQLVGDRVVIHSGLEAQQHVITYGAAYLSPGAPIAVIGR